jgi:hypothetical protein
MVTLATLVLLGNCRKYASLIGRSSQEASCIGLLQQCCWQTLAKGGMKGAALHKTFFADGEAKKIVLVCRRSN